MELDLIEGLAKLSAREHLPVSALVRRSIRRELEQHGILKPAHEEGGKRKKRIT
jgi:ribbon-helix-helix CopG family protein